ncbi:MAG: FxLYD domain-containing protein [Thermoanaerobaculia bacterium]
MPLLALIALLLQAAAATPTPAPVPTPTPAAVRTPTRAAAYGGTRTLSDVARERKLKGTPGAPSAKKGSVSVASGSAGGSPTPTATGSVTPVNGRLSPIVVVDEVHHDQVVGPNGQVRVEGAVRNAGNVLACDVSVTVRLYDDRGRYLVSGAAKADEPILRPGRSSSFAVWVQVPPGIAGAMQSTGPGSGPTSGSFTLEGNWRTLGRAEGEILSVADSCPGEKPAD